MTPFDQALPMMLYRVLDAVMPAHRELFARFDVTEQQWRILRALWDAESVSAADLAEVVLIPAPSLVGIIDRLESKQLVTRTRSTQDRRKVVIQLTEAGRELQTRVAPELELIHLQIRSCLDETEWFEMNRLLDKIAGNFIQHHRRAA